MATSCLSPKHTEVQHYDLGLRDTASELNWRVSSISYSGYRSQKLLTREGQALQEEHSLRWKEDPDELLKNFWQSNYNVAADALDLKVTVLRFEFHESKAQAVVLLTWGKDKKTQRILAEAALSGATVEAKVSAMSKAVDLLTTKISKAVQ